MSVSESQNGNGIPDKDVIKDYVDENLFSLVDTRKAGKHAGSNKSRFTIIKTNLKIGMDHPFLGVGYGLRQAYITDYLPPDSELNEELRKWKNNQAKLGILRSGYPSLGEYYVRFAETGIMGLALFVLPSLILLSKFFKIVFGRTYSGVCRDPFIFSSIAFAGTAVVGLGDGLTLTWCYWLLLGLGFAFVTDRNMLSEHNLGKETP